MSKPETGIQKTVRPDMKKREHDQVAFPFFGGIVVSEIFYILAFY